MDGKPQIQTNKVYSEEINKVAIEFRQNPFIAGEAVDDKGNTTAYILSPSFFARLVDSYVGYVQNAAGQSEIRQSREIAELRQMNSSLRSYVKQLQNMIYSGGTDAGAILDRLIRDKTL